MTKLQYENGYALLIGVQYMDWPKGRLPATKNDVKALASLLVDTQKAAYPPKQVTVLLEEAATTVGILKALDDLAEMTKDDPEATVILQYAGHGEVFNNEYFLLPYDFDLKNYKKQEWNRNKLILSSEFAKRIKAIKAKKLLVILDCCHAENMSTTERGIQGSFLSNLQKELSPEGINILDGSEVEETTERGLTDDIAEGSGRITLTACGEEEKALEINKHGIFTKALLDVLGGADNHLKDGYVDILDVIRFLNKEVPKRAQQQGHQQNPSIGMDKLKGRFIVCAYNIAKARGFATDDNVPPTSATDTDSLPNTTSIPNPQNTKKMTDEIKEKVNNLVGNNRIKECITYLLSEFSKNAELLAIKNDYTKNESQNRMGILDKRDYDLKHSQIVAKLLYFNGEEEA